MTTRIDSALTTAILRASHDAGPPRLASALRYAVFPGGARIRPRLLLATAEACGCHSLPLAEAAACAIELLHSASLVHDDLPCFDDAALRRGKLSVHRVYGEALAVLAGDALIVMAFETLARAGVEAPERFVSMTSTLARAAGTPYGLVAGQAWESEPSVSLEQYHRAKTASLFVAATMLGAQAAGVDPAPWRAMGELLGEAYQVADDLLDAVASSEEAGKPTGRDAGLERPNAVARLGIDGAVALLDRLVTDAADGVPDCPGAGGLRQLVVLAGARLVPASLKRTAA